MMIVPTLQTQKGLIFSFVLDDGFGTGFPSSSFVKSVGQLVTFGMGDLNDGNLGWTNRLPQPAQQDGHQRRDQIWSIDER
jgi:hypothetical protein